MIDKHNKAIEIFNLAKEVFKNINRTEIWKDVPNYEGIYQVSNLGNIKSLKYDRTGEERILKTNKDSGGYLKVNLYKNRKPKTYLVHRLVATVFLPNPDNLEEVNHINQIKNDNRVSNLEWCDAKYNCNYGTRNDRMVSTRTKKNSYGAEKSVMQLSKNGIKIINTYKSTQEASRQTGINRANICSCCRGKYKSAGGFVWKYL